VKYILRKNSFYSETAKNETFTVMRIKLFHLRIINFNKLTPSKIHFKMNQNQLHVQVLHRIIKKKLPRKQVNRMVVL